MALCNAVPARALHVFPSHCNELDLHLVQNQGLPASTPANLEVAANWKFTPKVKVMKHDRFNGRKAHGNDDSQRATVYRGILSQEDDKNPVEVVCKLLSGPHASRLTHEARIYANELRGLQGSEIPMFYGLFEGKESQGDIPWACLVVEFCGQTVDVAWAPKIAKMPQVDRERIDATMVKIHGLGVQHNDFAWENVVISARAKDKKMDIRVIDFDLAKIDECPAAMTEELLSIRTQLLLPDVSGEGIKLINTLISEDRLEPVQSSATSSL